MCVYLFAPSRGQPLCFSLCVVLIELKTSSELKIKEEAFFSIKETKYLGFSRIGQNVLFWCMV